MPKRVSIKRMRKEAPEWVFPWRPSAESPFPKWVATLLVGGVFVFLVTSVRIRVIPPAPWAAQKAAVIHVSDDAEGRELTLRAREGGPFPTRFEPSAWEGAVDLEQAALEAARWTPPPYVPVLRDLPKVETPPLRLAASGEAVLPKRKPLAEVVPVSAPLKLVPALYPLSGIVAAALPVELPTYDGAVDEKMTAEPWRFLVRLDAAGNVMDCVSLAGGNQVDPAPLEGWLRRISFKPEAAKPTRWIAVGVGFANQSTDGSNAR